MLESLSFGRSPMSFILIDANLFEKARKWNMIYSCLE